MADHLPFQAPERLPERRQGGGRPPPTPRNPRSHGEKLRADIDAATAVSRRQVVEGVDPRFVFKVKATTRMPDSAWEPRGLFFLGETEGWNYFVITEAGEPQKLIQALSRYAAAPDEEGAKAPLQSVFGNIEALEPYGPDDRRGPGIPTEDAEFQDPIVVDVQLWPSPDSDEARARVSEVHEVLAATAGSVVEEDVRPQSTVVRATVSRSALLALLDLAVVETIRTPPTPFLDPGDWISARVDDVEIRVIYTEPVGVIDDGVASGHPLLTDLILSERAFPSTRTWREIGPHGTSVAGIAAYADFEGPLRDSAPLEAGPVHVARVLEPNDQLENRAQFAGLEHRLVEDAIRTLHDEEGVRVFNLSIADPEPYSGPHVSLWTETLDGLVRELGIVIVVSAGNLLMPLQASDSFLEGRSVVSDYPDYLLDSEARIAEPGVAANVLTIGSIARSEGPASASGASHVGDRAIADIDEASPFTRTGPGIRDRAVKPDFVHYGGNIAASDVGLIQVANPGVAVVSTRMSSDGRLLGAFTGTSFAAPRVARMAANLWARYPNASANLIRCLLAISARTPERASQFTSQKKDRRRVFGLGLPSFDVAAESGPARTVLYYDGSIPVDSVEVIPIPIPEPLARGRYARHFRVAIAYDPPVRRQRREYIAGSLKAVLLRNVEPSEISRIYGRQPPDSEDRAELISDRRRLDMQPGVQTFTGTTLQARHYKTRQLRLDDGDVYYLLIIHQSEPWAGALREPYESQDYAVALQIETEEEASIDLRSLLEQRLRQRIEIRPRARR